MVAVGSSVAGGHDAKDLLIKWEQDNDGTGDEGEAELSGGPDDWVDNQVGEILGGKIFELDCADDTASSSNYAQGKSTCDSGLLLELHLEVPHEDPWEGCVVEIGKNPDCCSILVSSPYERGFPVTYQRQRGTTSSDQG